MKLNPQDVINCCVEGYNYLAKSGDDGLWYVFKIKPVLCESLYRWVGKEYQVFYGESLFGGHLIPLKLDFDGDWRDSLFTRESIENEDTEDEA